jgi:hypothetical protein
VVLADRLFSLLPGYLAGLGADALGDAFALVGNSGVFLSPSLTSRTFHAMMTRPITAAQKPTLMTVHVADQKSSAFQAAPASSPYNLN